jgi:carboxyl-terminal processing protease
VKQLALLLFIFALISKAENQCINSASDACLTDPFPPISSSDPLKIFDRATELVAQCFYDQTFSGVKWEDEAKRARATLSAASSKKEVQIVLSGLLAKLHASHTEFLTDFDPRYWALESIFTGQIDGAPIRQVGAVFENVEKKWFVRSTIEGSPSWVGGLRRGDEIISVNGKSLSPVKSFSKIVPGKCAKVKFRKREGGWIRSTCIVPVFESFQRSMLNGTRLSTRFFRGNGKRIGYFRLWAGTHEDFKKSLHAVAKKMEQNADALILDIRDGLGGASPAYLDPFFGPTLPIFSKPLYLLINDGTKSGKESLAYILKKTKRATLIGTKTPGYYLGGRLFDILPNEYALYLAVCGDSPVGVPLEGIGVSPDIEMGAPLPYAQGYDWQLRRALDLATED